MDFGLSRKRLAALLVLSAVALQPAAALGCIGDCGGDGRVAVDELIGGVNIALGSRAASECPAFDSDGDSVIAIDELVAGVNNALEGCPPPVGVSIDSPSPLALFAGSPISVSGALEGATAVTCNGIAATVAGAAFSATVPLHAAENIITCLAAGPGGRVASASVSVILDNVAPMVVIDSPRASLVTGADRVDVTGVVNDVLTVPGAAPPIVRVNDGAASVSNGTFVVTDVPLRPGPNLLTAVATDAVGNSDEMSITVTRRDLAGQRLRMVSGRNQMGSVGTELANPLEVELVDALGNGVAGRAVTFTVTRGSGAVAGVAGSGQTLGVITGAGGRAAVRFALGANAGRGSHRVTASAAGFAGDAVFCASATASAADHIVVISGDHQMGAVGELLPLPLVVGVLDTEGNPVDRAQVTFTVVEGDGSMPGGQTFTAMTGPDGRAAATLRLGPQPALNGNRLRADFPGLTGLPAVFTATSTLAGRAADTSVSGVVVDTSNQPVPGVTASIVGTSLEERSDDQGRFRIRGVPVGPIRLFLWGITATRDGIWPDLEFNLVTVAGQDNTIGRPIRLPALDEESSRIVGGNKDVTLTLADVPGFSLTVSASSATFPNGSRMGRLTVTQVHFDKVPMPPPNGSQFGLAWTLQPADVRFDPPARITLPNNGMPPGQLIDMFSFDHDLGMFVSIGSASVSPDGSIIQSDPGFGITKTGWGGGTPPPAPTTEGKHDPCFEAAAQTRDRASQGPEAPRLFANVQACIGQRVCQEAEDGNLADNDLARRVVPKFINRFLDNAGDWGMVLDMFPCNATTNFPLRDELCSAKMADLHMKDDLSAALSMEGCFSQDDWNRIFEDISTCSDDELGAVSTVATPVVRFLRDRVRNQCCATRGDC